MKTRTLTVDVRHLRRLIAALSALLLGAAIFYSQRAPAQEPEAPALLTAAELEELVGPVALYPDDLLAIVLPASTYPLQIVQAARFLDDRANDSTLEPDPEWDNSIVALLNYPEIVRMMNEDLDWTWDLGAAVIADQAAVINAVQLFRDRAYAAGNLQTDDRQIVTKEAEVIEIAPADPEVIYIPYYEPERVVVYHSTPAYYYYPYAYPVYYYPYPVGYGFTFGFFWGVTSAYSIGWHSHWLHVHHHTHIGHPYYHHPYYDYSPYYGHYGVVANVHTGHASNVWHHDAHHGGPHPQHRQIRVAYEGYGEPRSGGGDGTAYGFARTPSRTAGRTETEGGARSADIARQLGAAREGRSAQPFAAAPGAETQARSDTERSTTAPSRLGGVANRSRSGAVDRDAQGSRPSSAQGARAGSSTRTPVTSGSAPSATVRSEGRMLGRVATESPWRSREDFSTGSPSVPRDTGSRSAPPARSLAPSPSSEPRASSGPRSSFVPPASSPSRSAPQSSFSGGGRASAPQHSAPSSSGGRMSGGGHSSGGGRSSGGRAGRSD
jgi:uncharacterized membrane protein YgcG